MDVNEILEELIKKDEIEWEDIINELINKKIIDPKNIDLNVLIDHYIKIVRELKSKQTFDFILTSKVLVLLVFFLKLKIEYLSRELYNFEENNLEEEFVFEEEEKENTKKNRKKREKKELEFIIKLERKRKVDLEDLKKVIKEVLEEYKEKKKKIKKEIEDLEDLKKLEYDIENEIKNLEKILEKLERKVVEFKYLLKKMDRGGDKENVIKTFIPLLYLENQEKIELKQEEIFKEILIIKKEKNESEYSNK